MTLGRVGGYTLMSNSYTNEADRDSDGSVMATVASPCIVKCDNAGILSHLGDGSLPAKAL